MTTNQEVFDDIEVPEGELTALEIVDPGLYPRFTYFHVATRTGWLKLIPGKANLLVSAYSMTQGYAAQPGDAFLQEAVECGKSARKVFVDSGAITPLGAVARGKMGPEKVHDWLARQPEVVEVAWKLYEGGCKEGVVGAMDVPSTAPGVKESGLEYEDAIAITVKNAVTMAAEEIPPDWKRVFMAQGRSPDEFVNTMKMYESEGLLDLVRRGEAWLGIGGINRKKSPTLDTIIRVVRDELGEGHIHALGVAGERVAPFAARDLVQSSDATSALMTVTKNSGPYRISGPRPTFLLYAMWAASAMRYDTLLARKIRSLEGREFIDQDELFSEEEA